MLRTAIADSKKSYRQIAVESGVPSGTVFNWAHGRTQPRDAAGLINVLNAVGVSPINVLRAGLTQLG